MADVSFNAGDLEQEATRELAEVLTGQGGLAWQAIQQSHARLRSYSDDYDVEPVIDSLVVPRSGPAFVAGDEAIDLRWEWRHPAAEFFDRGTSDHTIQGEPVLSFIWEGAPAAVRQMFPHTERVDGDPRVFFTDVEVRGISETRFARYGWEWLRDQLRREFE